MAEYIDIKDILACQEDYHYWMDELAKSVAENDPETWVDFHPMASEAFHTYAAALKKELKQKKGAFGFICLQGDGTEWNNEVCFMSIIYDKAVKECIDYDYAIIVAVNEKGYKLCEAKLEAKKPWDNIFWEDIWEV